MRLHQIIREGFRSKMRWEAAWVAENKGACPNRMSFFVHTPFFLTGKRARKMKGQASNDVWSKPRSTRHNRGSGKKTTRNNGYVSNSQLYLKNWGRRLNPLCYRHPRNGVPYSLREKAGERNILLLLLYSCVFKSVKSPDRLYIQKTDTPDSARD